MIEDEFQKFTNPGSRRVRMGTACHFSNCDGKAHQHTVLDKRPCRFGGKCLVVSLHHAPRDAPQRFLVARSQAFVVGFGLDYEDYYRNLPFVGVLKPAVYQDQ